MATTVSDCYIGVRIPRDLRDRLYETGREQDRSASWLARQALTSYLAQLEQPAQSEK
jgi:hypothetical protein